MSASLELESLELMTSHKKRVFEDPPITEYLCKEEYKEMIQLAKELGMTNIGDYILYCMRAVLKSHYNT